MLKPADRHLLFEALRPPPNHTLDCALGTTYTLDLLALLTAPLAFATFDWLDEAEQPARAANLHALFEAVRRHADHITIFCQAGRIAVPRHVRLIYPYLEDAVVPVKLAQRVAVFHPKVWVLRYVSGVPSVRYRLLCLSRNLTFDRSWDTVLQLEGTVPARGPRRRNSVTAPLAEFVAALPDHAVEPAATERARTRISRIHEELPYVTFEPPPAFDELVFWPMGIAGHDAWPFDEAGGRIDRMLVVSPFLSGSRLERLTARGRGHVLVSRAEWLAQLKPGELRRFERVYVLSEAAASEPTDAEQDEDADAGNAGDAAPSALPERARDPATDTATDTAEGTADIGVSSLTNVHSVPPTGLHAKVYVADSGTRARVWTGSANATDAAFGYNVEFLIELRGRKRDCGVDVVLAPSSDEPSLLSLLEEFRPPAAPDEPDREQVELDRRADDVRDTVIEARLMALASALAAGEQAGAAHSAAAAGDAATYTVALAPAAPLAPVPPGVSVRCWPITLPDSRAEVLSIVTASGGGATASGTAAADARRRSQTTPGARAPVCVFANLSAEAVTSFFAFEVAARGPKKVARRQFVLNLPLEGAPTDRRERVLRALLSDRAKVLQFLLFLLAEGSDDARSLLGALVDGAHHPVDQRPAPSVSGLPLLEPLLRALVRDPAKLDRVRGVIEDLLRGPDGTTLLPEGFAEIWEPIWQARRSGGAGGGGGG